MAIIRRKEFQSETVTYEQDVPVNRDGHRTFSVYDFT